MRDRHREAWTAFFEAREQAKPSKYGNQRAGKYASKKEAEYAAKYAALESAGVIRQLREQVPFELIPKDGRLRAVKYYADFTYVDEGGLHVVDIKGGSATKTPVYRLKKRLMRHLLGIDIEEV